MCVYVYVCKYVHVQETGALDPQKLVTVLRRELSENWCWELNFSPLEE